MKFGDTVNEFEFPTVVRVENLRRSLRCLTKVPGPEHHDGRGKANHVLDKVYAIQTRLLSRGLL